MFEYDKYYRECQKLNKPFIKAKTNPKNGKFFVQIDLMTCRYELSKQEQEQIKKLAQKEIGFVKSNSKSNFNRFSIDKELVWFDGISPEHVNEFCENLYDMIQKYQN